MFGLGPIELTIVLVLVLLVFGPRLPRVARNVGRGLVEFRDGLRDGFDSGEGEEEEPRLPAGEADGR